MAAAQEAQKSKANTFCVCNSRLVGARARACSLLVAPEYRSAQLETKGDQLASRMSDMLS